MHTADLSLRVANEMLNFAELRPHMKFVPPVHKLKIHTKWIYRYLWWDHHQIQSSWRSAHSMHTERHIWERLSTDWSQWIVGLTTRLVTQMLAIFTQSSLRDPSIDRICAWEFSYSLRLLQLVTAFNLSTVTNGSVAHQSPASPCWSAWWPVHWKAIVFDQEIT